jgi:hypothetical protein
MHQSYRRVLESSGFVIVALEEWEGYDRVHPAPTFFARPAFARALHDAFPRLQPALVRVVYGGEKYMIPVVRQRNAVGLSSGCGFPLGGYTCVRDENGHSVGGPQLSAIVERAAREFDSFEFTGWPMCQQPHVRGWISAELNTAVIDCRGGVSSALAGMRGVARRMAGQAERRGVDCVRSDGGPVAVKQYYGMLADSSMAWGLPKPTISLELLQAVFAHGGANAELWFAMLEGTPIAGGVALFGADELFFWSAAMRREYARHRPSNALNVRLIERACERGVHWYNLGASEGLAGVERFKHDLGARDVAYRRIEHRSRVAELYRSVRTGLRAGMVRS